MEQDRISQVRQRAHAIWIEQGQPEGAAHEHWAQAEAEFDDGQVTDTAAPATERADVPADVEATPTSEVADTPAAPEIVAAPEAVAAPAPARKPTRRKVKSVTPTR